MGRLKGTKEERMQIAWFEKFYDVERVVKSLSLNNGKGEVMSVGNWGVRLHWKGPKLWYCQGTR